MQTNMHIDATLLNSFSALIGALAGGSASLLAAIYTQRYQNRLQRVAAEIARRETVYADFVMNASSCFVNAQLHDDITVGCEEHRLIGLVNRIRLFAPLEVVREAEAVLRFIVDVSLKPGIELRQLAKNALSQRLQPDLLLAFSLVCRADLDAVHRTAI